MAIFESDVHLRKSERMTDNPDGGGFITGNEIVDGVSNNAFNDISTLDRTYGRVSLRKAYLSIESPNVDTYLGAHIIVLDGPDDPNVFATIFSTVDWDDERIQAENYIEAFRTPTGNTTHILNGSHPTGSFGLSVVYDGTIITNPTTGALSAGTLLYPAGTVVQLIYHEDLVDELEQFVKVASVSYTVQTFNNASCGNFNRIVASIVLESALEFTFPGDTPHCNVATFVNTKIRFTVANTNSRYYSITSLTLPASLGDTQITVASTKSQLVPVGVVFTPQTNQVPIPSGTFAIESHASTVSLVVTTVNGANTIYLGGPVTPGSLIVATQNYTDDANGNVLNSSLVVVGTIEYTTGRIIATYTVSGGVSHTFKPAGVVSRVLDNDHIEVTSGNQSLSYSRTLPIIPIAKNTLNIQYESGGIRYTATDDGLGAIIGSGSGAVNYTNGSVSLTLSALPDIGTTISFYWGCSPEVRTITAVSSFSKLRWTFTFAAQVSPSSFSLTWSATALNSHTVTDNGAGLITGTGGSTGTLNYLTGEVIVEPAVMHNSSFTGGSPTLVPTATVFPLSTDVTTVTDNVGTYSTTLSSLPVQTNSVYMSAMAQGIKLEAKDDGLGNLRLITTNAIVGTVNYLTGAVSGAFVDSLPRFNPVYGIRAFDTWTGSYVTGYSSANQNHYAVGVVSFSYRTTTAVSSGGSLNISAGDLRLNTIHNKPWGLNVNSLRFTVGALVFVDRAGVLVNTINSSTNIGTSAGTVNYVTGEVTWNLLSQNTVGGSATVTGQGALLSVHQQVVTSSIFRTAIKPLSASGYSLQDTEYNNGVHSQGATGLGVIDGNEFFGTVNFTTGISRVSFGAYETYTGAQNSEPWFNAALIVGPNILRPSLILANTFLYNYTSQGTIPLDPDLIDLDTSLLPADGKVDTILPSDVIVIHQTINQNLPNPLLPSTSHNTGYIRLAKAIIKDQNGLVFPPTLNYTVNLDTGIYTFLSTLDTTGYVQPFIAIFRIEDMALVLSVSPTGVLQLNKQISRAYPATLTRVSGALVIGDMQARYTNLFDQATWTSVFSNTVIGSVATANYNDVTYPIAVTNQGAIQERWALVFTNSTTFNVIGEILGQIATGNTSTNLAPINPNTGVPYFTLQALGWGAGWSTGNALRFNTLGANFPVWMARSVLPSTPTTASDSFTVSGRGDVDS